MGKIKKSALVERSAQTDAQERAIWDACHSEMGDKGLEFRIVQTGDEITTEADKRFEVIIPYELVQQFQIPTILKYTPHVDKPTKMQMVEQPIRITCDLIDEMLVAVQLLTPSPLDWNSYEISSKQYVPVSSCRFFGYHAILF